jgi:hypothetical protein
MSRRFLVRSVWRILGEDGSVNSQTKFKFFEYWVNDFLQEFVLIIIFNSRLFMKRIDLFSKV